MDPEYFLFAAEKFRNSLNGEDDQKAALAIRNIYHHSLETLFTLICATIQAPYCIYGWMNMAKIGDVRAVLKLIGSNKKFYNFLAMEFVDWQSFAEKIFLIDTINKINQKVIELASMYSKLWSSMCNQYLNDHSIKEYNSIKHGFRSKPGGWRFSFGPINTGNNTSPKKEMFSFGDTKYGSSFHVIKAINGLPEKDCNIQASKYSVNWDPVALLNDIKLVSISIHNILTFLKIAHDVDPLKVTFLAPDNLRFFEEHQKSVVKTSYMKLSMELSNHNIKKFTKEELENMMQVEV